MSVDVMLSRAFNQAVASNAIKFADRDADFAVIKTYMMDYAKKYDVKVSEEQIKDYIVSQRHRWDEAITKITIDGANVDIENISYTYKPEQMTKEETLKMLFDFAASTPGVHFTHKDIDMAIIKNVMRSYNEDHHYGLSDDEIDAYIKTQMHRWNDAVSNINVINADVTVSNVSSTYAPEDGKMTKERALREGFEYAAANPAVRFTGTDIDFLVIKNMMKDFARACKVELTDEEIVSHIKSEFQKMNKAVEDFSFAFKVNK